MLKDEADAKYLSMCMLYFDRYHLKTNNVFLRSNMQKKLNSIPILGDNSLC